MNRSRNHSTLHSDSSSVSSLRREVGGRRFPLLHSYTLPGIPVYRRKYRCTSFFEERSCGTVSCSFQIHVLFCTYFTFSATYCAVRYSVLDLSDPDLRFPSYPLLGGNTRNRQLLPMKRFIIRSARCYGRTQFGFLIDVEQGRSRASLSLLYAQSLSDM